MTTLALEFSSVQRSVAVMVSNRDGEEAICEVVEAGGRSTRALGMIEEVLRQAQIEREQVQRIAVGLGPGSYTGIRAAISVAQGWQLATQVKLLGISSTECVVAQAEADGLTGRMAVVIDAQRNEFYLGRCKITAAGRVEEQPLCIATLAQVQECEAQGCVLIGPDVARWFRGGREVVPRAAALVRLASGRDDFVPGEQLQPIYLREAKFVKAPPARNLA
jgi:tRNA threonylcarbamoyladenosine biosynthesis protein TsaB